MLGSGEHSTNLFRGMQKLIARLLGRNSTENEEHPEGSAYRTGNVYSTIRYLRVSV
jgi:hypothetical protein